LGLIGGTLLLLKYSRDDELEADRLGVIYMKQLGYDPRYAIQAHENLDKAFKDYKKSIGESSNDDSIFGDLLATHPRTQVRIDEIKNLIATTPAYPVRPNSSNDAYFQYMTTELRRINKLYRDYYDKALIAFNRKDINEAEKLITQAIWIERTQPSFYALYALFNSKKQFI